MSAPLTIGSLCSGIGGLEMGLERAGLGPVIWQCEIDPFCRSVLAKHWPHVTRYDDIRTLSHPPTVDLVCAGFPCTDISVAGRGAGITGPQSGLWKEVARVIGEIGPRFVVIENVSALASRGLDVVTADLGELGFRSWARIIQASDVGAPHRRARLFIVAMADANRRRREELGVAQPGGEQGARGGEPHRCGGPRQLDDGEVADADGDALRDQEQRRSARRLDRVRDEGLAVARDDGGAGLVAYADGERLGSGIGVEFCARQRDASEDGGRPAESELGRGAHGVSRRVHRWPAPPGEEQHAWEPPRAVTYDVTNRPARLRALGNAVVPQCAELVGRFVRQLAEGFEP